MCKKLFLLTSFVLVLGLVVNASSQPTGQIMREVWENIGGTSTSDLTNNAAYPDSPSYGELMTSLEAPTDFADNYGSRIHGWLYPATSGDYTFWIASDDASDLWLSTSDSPDDALVICGVDGWTDSRQFDGGVGAPGTRQMSAPVALEAGQKYYISAIYKEGGGGDNLAVAWQGPDSPERSVIDGAFLSPAAWAPGLMKAQNPDPADGAVDAVAVSLMWEAGVDAVSHVVYLNGELIAETDQVVAFATLNPGTAYTWRVDEVQADGTVIEGNTWSFTTLPLEAHFPSPADGAVDIESAKLTWTVGKNTIINDVYFGTDEALVAAGDPSTFKGKLMVASYDPGALELFTTYYWKVNEFTPTGTVAGPVWSFSTPKEVIILSGEQTLNYNNSAEPYVSELALDVPADLTAEGVVADLTLTFKGAAGNLSIDEATGTYKITGAGADIWGSSDQFHYVYMNLTGDGEISARVVSNGTGSNTWAKGGVMIRETTAGNSKQMLMGMTGGDGGGIAFQGRFADTGANSSSLHGDLIAAPPYYVKLTRTGNTITAYSSADGVEWALMTDTSPDNSGGTITNPIDVAMADPVLIGLFVTSHAAGENRTYTFDNVSISGGVDGVLVSEDIDSVSGNSAEPIYVALEDSTGVVSTVTHPYPAATQITAKRGWRIPLSAFAGVDVTAAAKLYVGVGDGEPGGAGAITVSNIRVVKAVSAGNIIWVSDGYDDNADGASDDLEWVDILEAEGYSVDYQINGLGDGYWRTLDDAKIAALNAADLVIVSRNSDSGSYASNADEIAQWNAITAPLINNSTHIIRNSRWKWLDSTTILSLTPMMVLADGTEIPGINAEVGPGSFMDSAPGNGVVLATGDGLPWIIKWEAGVEFYDGAGQIAGGPRMFFVAGSQEAAPEIGRGEMNLTPEALAVFLAAVDDMIPAKLSDITQPSDIVKGVPNDGDWPGAEHPALAIDNNTGTKFLHFKGETEPTGIQVTPLNGSSIVTGITLTTANDSPNRDPATFELSGSNVGIDGPYELIAAGDIVDFAGEAEYPRFTMTAIMFDNDVAYAHYQIMFPTVRDAGTANSMQIAEVELLGVPEPKPADITAPGDAIQGVPNDGLMNGNNFGWPAAETPDLAIDNNTGKKFLHFKGELEPTGIQVTPASGASIVTGLTLTTANDSPERDPISFELSGSNEGIDGPYELIAAGDIVDFAGEAAYPRFRMNATPITFDNDVAYAHYQLLFPTVRNPASANSMQIAEVELLGFTVTPPLIASVVRSGGVSGDRDPIGAYDGSTTPLATEAGGLKDGNMVYSDRTYPWSGIPAEYVGSEYVRTFNSDKNTGTVDVTYQVTISRPAIVWLTVDDRIPAEWNAGGTVNSMQNAADRVTAAIAPAGTFTDTGVDIYVHENDTTDRMMSVFAAVLPAGTYVFGSMDSGKNYYTIGAIE